MLRIFFFKTNIIILFLFGCREPDSSYYTINKVKVIAALFQTSPLVVGTTLQSTSTQQFPIRPSCGAVEFDVVVVSPTNEIPTLSMDNFELFGLGNYYLSAGGGSRGLPAGTRGTSVSFTSIFNSLTPTITNLMTTPFRLTVFTYTVNCGAFTNAVLTNNLQQIGDIPGFQLSYSTTTGISHDQGFYSFYFLPLPTDLWWTATSFPSKVTASEIAQLTTGLAVTNSPIQLSTPSPSSGSVIYGNASSPISVNVTVPSVPSPRNPKNSNFQASTRIQWYVSSGSLSLDTSSSTNWNPEAIANSTVGGVVVVRDLLGGVDIKLLGPFTTQ